jgi:hypothetical protein
MHSEKKVSAFSSNRSAAFSSSAARASPPSASQPGWAEAAPSIARSIAVSVASCATPTSIRSSWGDVIRRMGCSPRIFSVGAAT